MPLPPPVIIENLFSSLNIVLSLKCVLKILRFDHYPFNSAQSKTFLSAALQATLSGGIFHTPLLGQHHLSDPKQDNNASFLGWFYGLFPHLYFISFHSKKQHNDKADQRYCVSILDILCFI